MRYEIMTQETGGAEAAAEGRHLSERTLRFGAVCRVASIGLVCGAAVMAVMFAGTLGLAAAAFVALILGLAHMGK